MKQLNHYINFNGKIIPQQELIIPTTNRSFRYGDGLFESIRIKDGRPLFIEDHLNRLYLGMKTLKIRFPSPENIDFENLIINTCQAQGILDGGYARLMVYRRGEGKYLPEKPEADFIIEVFPLENDFTWRKENLNLGVYSELKKPIDQLSLIKNNNAQLYILAAIFAQENNFGDALILNEKNQIIETTSSNLFWIKNTTVYSPPISAGPLPGIMRLKMLELVNNMGYLVNEICPTEEDLLNADEIFLTNAIIGIKAVSGFKQKRYFRNQSLKIVNMLNTYSNNYLIS